MAFEGIATAKANAEKSLQNALELFKSYAKGVFSRGAERWSIRTLDQISTNLDRKRIPITKSDRKSGDFPYYGASGIVDYVADYIFDGDTLLISEDGANLLARSSPIAFSVSGQYWVNNHAHILKFEHMATQRFVEFYLESIPLDEYITGAAQPKLNQKALNSIPIPIPTTLEEQKQVVDHLDMLTAQIESLQGNYTLKLSGLDELKKSLLHQAFTGQL
jgi:type I restriction enzyme S subunit